MRGTETTSGGAATWPPPFSVRLSARARHARLRVVPGKGLEVVLPRGCDPSLAPAMVEEHRAWIERTLRRLGLGSREGACGQVPRSVVLHGGEAIARVVCAGDDADGEVSDGGIAVVRLRASRHETARCLHELQTWFRVRAAAFLRDETERIAALHGFSFSALRFRRQKSRWGSCTAEGAISLNTCLVFLPLDLCRHVILHELAHTRHCNHGPGFWQTLFSAEPNAMALDKRLRAAWKFVPAWVWQTR